MGRKKAEKARGATNGPKAVTAKPAAAEPATVPSTPGSMEAPAIRQLTDSRLEQMRERFVSLYGELEAHEESAKELAKQANDERARAKEIREELHELRESINTGLEEAKQGDIFAHQQPRKPRPAGPAETEGQAHALSPTETDGALAEVGRRGEELLAKGGGGATGDPFAFGENEPPPAVDPAQAGPTRVEAEREEPAEAGA